MLFRLYVWTRATSTITAPYFYHLVILCIETLCTVLQYSRDRKLKALAQAQCNTSAAELQYYSTVIKGKGDKSKLAICYARIILPQPRRAAPPLSFPLPTRTIDLRQHMPMFCTVSACRCALPRTTLTLRDIYCACTITHAMRPSARLHTHSRC